MAVKEIEIRELKAHLSAYLKLVKGGETLTIVERGQTIGYIIPAGQDLQERLHQLARAGFLAWSGKRLKPIAPLATAKGEKSVADLLLEDRE